MPSGFHLGEFEQMVLLVLLRTGPWTSAPALIEELARRAPRAPTRGAVYRTLDRSAEKGYVDDRSEAGSSARAGLPRRAFRVAPAGVDALRASRALLQELWSGLEEVLE